MAHILPFMYTPLRRMKYSPPVLSRQHFYDLHALRYLTANIYR